MTRYPKTQALMARGCDFLGTEYAILCGAMSWVSERNLVSAISNGLIVEYYRDSVDPMWRKMFKETLLLNDDGTLSPPNRPGLGIDLNEEALRPFRVE